MTCDHIRAKMTKDATNTWNHISTRITKDTTMTLDLISAIAACMMWHEEHFWNVSILKKYTFPILLLLLT
jgi:hypothetical protein